MNNKMGNTWKSIGLCSWCRLFIKI